MNKIWTTEVSDALRALIGEGVSYGEAAYALNRRFNLAITRHAAIGRGYRIGLIPPKPQPRPKVPKADRPRRSTANHDITLVRMVRGKGNSNNLRITTSREATEQYKIRCVEIIPLNLTTVEIDLSTQCQYIAGDDLLHCGHPSYSYVREGSDVTIKSSYCRQHYELTRQEPKPRRDQARLWSAA